MARAAVWSVALVLLGGAAAEAVEAVWIGPEVGAWNVAANWSTGLVPGFNYVARIDDNPAQNTRVESRTSASSVSLIVIDPGDTLAVINSQFSVGRILSLEGAISVEGNNAQINIGLLTLNPGGTLRLAGTNATATLPQLINEGVIHGGGRLTLGSSLNPPPAASYNEATIRADHPTIPLTLQLPTNTHFENRGTLMAMDGGRLQIQRGFFFDPFALIGGRIEAHPGSTVSLGTVQQSTMLVEDAVLAMIDDEDPLTAAPKFEFYSAELKDATLEGNFKLTGAHFIGSLTNPGEITTGAFNSTMNWHNNIEGDMLLKGGGTVYLPGSSQALFGTQGPGAPGHRLINVDNVVRGRGELLVSWAGFINRNVVQADAGQNAELIVWNGLSDDGFKNSGVMKATNGGRLRLGYGGGSLAVMENFEGSDAGEIIAAENSSVMMSNIHIKGGVIRPEGDDPATRGKFLAEQLVVFEGVTTEGEFRFQTLAGQLSTITLNNRVYNEGTITARFAVSTSAELAGGGEIIGESGTLFSFTISTASFVNIDNIIRGTGNIYGTANNRFTNRGTIRPDGSITFHAQLPVVNSGRIEAGPGTQVTMPTIPVVLNQEQGSPGVIHAADGGIVNITRVDGGILSTEGTGLIRGTGGFIKDVHNLGTLEVDFVQPQGTIVNDGVIRGTLSVTSAFARLDGTGTWETQNSTLQGGLFINGPQHTILGSDGFGTSSTPQTVFVNEGTLRAKEGFPFSIATFAFENSGLVHAPADRTISITSATGRVENDTGTIQVDGNISFNAPAGIYNFDEGLIDVRGRLTLEQTILRNRPDGMIIGTGEIAGAIATGPLVLNEGIIEPGAGLATLRIGDDFQQAATGQLQMEISAGLVPLSDLLAVDGAASLAGKLSVSLVGEDALAAGHSFTLITATGGIMGAFSQLFMPTLDENLFWYVQYLATEFRATVAEVIPGDFNRNGSVGAEDYVLWRKNGGEPSGYGDWAAHFGQTVNVEESLSLAEAPEPTSGSMLLACGAMVLALRRNSFHSSE
ncbi:MAG: hypothetical protein WD738_17480 [Pirellulales bacterium]